MRTGTNSFPLAWMKWYDTTLQNDCSSIKCRFLPCHRISDHDHEFIGILKAILSLVSWVYPLQICNKRRISESICAMKSVKSILISFPKVSWLAKYALIFLESSAVRRGKRHEKGIYFPFSSILLRCIAVASLSPHEWWKHEASGWRPLLPP